MVRTQNKISDIELVKILERNAREPFIKIAKIFNVSETAVRKRVRKLEREGVIRKYTVDVDFRKLGFKIHALIGVDTKPENYMMVIEKLKAMEEVKSLFSSTGDHMLMLDSWFKDSDELASFIKKLENIEGVTKICPAIILDRLK